MAEDKRRIIIVGGGPVGSIMAIFLGRRGYSVDLFEARSDIREKKNAAGRSINLSLSHRGISALKEAGVDEKIIAIGTAMHSRYIHSRNGSKYAVPYGKNGQYLLSTDRLELNRQLLTAAESCPNVKLHFQHKLVSCDTKTPSATFKNADGETVTIRNSKVLFGCDGAHSAVRSQMLKSRMDFSQTYIEHGYKELTIPPSADGEYALPPNHLHIWPRHEFMLIALPNLDRSFTCTLFMPFSMFNAITMGDDVIQFFEKYFDDVIPLIGKDLLKKTFFSLPPLPMVTVRCTPYHFGNTSVIMGDAAHAVVPFYGQGLNCGLEDALVFDELMHELECDFDKVLPRFSELRVRPGHSVADLSLYNYIEMRSSVAKPWFLLRKNIDGILNRIMPSMFIPRYSMVTFTRIPYDEVIKRAERQDRIVDTTLIAMGCAGIAAGLFGVYYIYRNSENFSRNMALFFENNQFTNLLSRAFS